MTTPDSAPDPVEDLVAECLRRRSQDGTLPLDELCRHHPQFADALRARVRALQDVGMASTSPDAPPLAQPAQIGPYRILEPLGEGGMGTVYLAEQKTPVRRRVALKVIKLGMDSKQVLARFEAERQALAMMEHDHIAKVFDAGTTDRGQPFFVMEHVKGVPITEYCDAHRSSVSERLGLFTQVCAAVQHAHHKGVIHRDLKPGNVLVTETDGKPTAKVIDFGLARATDHMLVQHTVFTERGMLLGTPEYMSPEQADPGATDIDTRTDVYSLGVMLHELLVGCLPFSPRDLRRAGWSEMLRLLREVEPPRPSTALSGLGNRMAATARARATSIRSLRNLLETDLDWVILKALHKDRRQRYATPSELAADVHRFLANEPVSAGPPSTAYRLRKFLRRRRATAAAIALVCITAVVSQFVALKQARDAANHARSIAYAAFKATAKPYWNTPQKRLEEQAEAPGGHTVSLAADLLGAEFTANILEHVQWIVAAARLECISEQEVTLTRVLETRFGRIQDTTLRQVRTADTSLAHQRDLNLWTLRAVTAPSLDQVFAPR